MNKILLVNQIVKIYYPSKEMELEQLTCKVIEETVNAVKVEYVHTKEFEIKQRLLTKDEVLRGMEENKDLQTKEMTCDEFVDSLHNKYFFDEMIQDMKSRDDYHSDKMFSTVVHEAHTLGVHLKDINDYDYDKEMHNLYKTWQL